MIQRIRNTILTTGLLLSTLSIGTPAGAQVGDSEGSRWTAWLGCWESEPAIPGVSVDAGIAVICLVPSDATTAEVITVADDEVVERFSYDASGARNELERDGCTGWESMEFSPDGRRVYQQSEYECPGPFRRTTSGVLTMLPGDIWLNVQGVAAGEVADVRVMRYRPAPVPSALRDEMQRAIEGRAMQVQAARLALAEPVSVEAVIEATRTIHPAMVEGWLIERGQSFDLNAARLIALDDAGVPDGVIDLMVALSNPRVFAVDREARQGDFRPSEAGAAVPASAIQARPGYLYDPFFDRWYYDSWGYRYDRYGYRYGYGGGWYSRPVIIIREPGSGDGEVEGERPSRLINGRGYTRGGAPSNGGSNSSGQAVRRPEPSSSGPSSSVGSSGSSGSTGAGGSSSSGDSGGSTPRTARPRDGGS